MFIGEAIVFLLYSYIVLNLSHLAELRLSLNSQLLSAIIW